MIINILRKVAITGIILYTIISISGCNKEQGVLSPLNNASFSFQGIDNKEVNDSLLSPTSFSLNLNIEIDSSSYNCKWDFGNGETSNSYNPKPVYNDAGTYTITMYVSSKEGNAIDTIRRTVIVKDRRLDSIKINNIDWARSDLLNGEIPLDAHIGVFCQLVSFDDHAFNNMNIVFQSKIIENVIRNSTVEISVDTIAYLPTLYSYDSKVYGYSLYATYEGKNYLLSTSWGSGISSSFYDSPTIISSGNGYSFSSQLTVGFPVGSTIFYGNFQYP